MVIYDDDPIFIFVSYSRGVQLGDESDKDHNGVKDEAIEHVVIPSRVKGLPVIKLGFRCFKSLLNLLTAFIPNTIELMRTDCFQYCQKLHNITFEKNSRLSTFHLYLFYSTNISYFTFPPSAATIGDYSFFDCKNLKHLVIPNFLSSNATKMFNYVSLDLEILVPINYP